MQKRITDAFRRQADGSWICIDAITVDHPSGRMQFTPGTVYHPEDIFMGVKIAKWLDALADTRRMSGSD